jgi:hypothetical protein
MVHLHKQVHRPRDLQYVLTTRLKSILVCHYFSFINHLICVAVSPAPLQEVSLVDKEQPDWAGREVEEKQRHAWARFHEEECWENVVANNKAERDSIKIKDGASSKS